MSTQTEAEKAAAAQRAADEKAASDKKAADDKTAADKKAANDKAAAEATAATASQKAKNAEIEPAFALHRINGTILPGTLFRPATQQDRDDLVALNAIRDLEEAELAIFERTGGSPVELGDSDLLG